MYPSFVVIVKKHKDAPCPQPGEVEVRNRITAIDYRLLPPDAAETANTATATTTNTKTYP